MKNTMRWRLHRAIFTFGGWSAADEASSILDELCDTVEWLDGPGVLLPLPNEPLDTPSFTMTVLGDAKRVQRSNASYGVPGLFYGMAGYAVADLLAHLPPSIPWINRRAVLLPAGRLMHMSDDHAKALAQGEHFLFVKPNSGNKAFTGDIFPVDDFASRVTGFFSPMASVEASTLCAVAPAVAIDPIEWRFWIVGDTVVTHASYGWSTGLREDATPPTSVIDLAGRLARMAWRPDQAFVADIATVNGDAALIEINAMSTSGLYPGVDVKALLSGLRLAAMQRFEAQQSDTD